MQILKHFCTVYTWNQKNIEFYFNLKIDVSLSWKVNNCNVNDSDQVFNRDSAESMLPNELIIVNTFYYQKYG